MRLREVNFEGTIVKMPFLSVEECEDNAGLFVEALKAINVRQMRAGICYEIKTAQRFHRAGKGWCEAEHDALTSMLNKLFNGTMPSDDDGGAYCYLTSYVKAQLAQKGDAMSVRQHQNQNSRMREFWIKHQLAILEQTA